MLSITHLQNQDSILAVRRALTTAVLQTRCILHSSQLHLLTSIWKDEPCWTSVVLQQEIPNLRLKVVDAPDVFTYIVSKASCMILDFLPQLCK